MIPSLISMTRNEVAAMVEKLGQPAYRTDQILEWIYRHRVREISRMNNLPAPLREALAPHTLRSLEKIECRGAADQTRKFLFRLDDGRLVESVLIPASPALYGTGSDRRTLCLSTQVGCAMGCTFCASGLAGLTRNLRADEIVEQLLAVEEDTGEKINNLVFMGMGEPLANLDELTRALTIFNAPWGLGIGARQITVSTVGLAPAIRKLASIPMQIRLAVSLHAATDAVRERLMPVNKKWNLEELFSALNAWRLQKKQMLSLEFILIDDVNDDEQQARLLARHARALHAKINLIPYNSVEGLPWQRPSEERCRRFLEIVTEGGATATLRTEKGHDIEAACGQLRLREEKRLGILPEDSP